MASKVSRQLIVWIVSAGLVGASLFIGAFAQNYDRGIVTKHEFIGKVQGGIEAPPTGQDHLLIGECLPGAQTSQNWHPNRLYQVTRDGMSEDYTIDAVGWTDSAHNAHAGKIRVLERVFDNDTASMPRAYRICFSEPGEECQLDDHPGHGTVR
jgi:hypothetical protein